MINTKVTHARTSKGEIVCDAKHNGMKSTNDSDLVTCPHCLYYMGYVLVPRKAATIARDAIESMVRLTYGLGLERTIDNVKYKRHIVDEALASLNAEIDRTEDMGG